MRDEIIKKVKKLSIAERIDIVENIWESIIDSKDDFPITEEQKAELDKRLAAYYDDPSNGSPWGEVVKRLRTQL